MKKVSLFSNFLSHTRLQPTCNNGLQRIVVLRSTFVRMLSYTRDVFYVRREVDLMKTAKVNAYIMHIFGKIELLSIHAT